MKKGTTEKESTTYQVMLTEVEGIIREVSDEKVDLDQLVTKIEKGYTLIKQMRGRLDETKKKLEQLRQDFESPAGIS